MAQFKEINELYQNKFKTQLPRTTLTKWVKEGKVKAIKLNNGRYDYDIKTFNEVINSNQYIDKLKATKEKPENYIGTVHEQT